MISRSRIPRTEREWLRLRDWLRVRWIDGKRKPLRGRVRVSYLWESEPAQTLEEEAEIGVELASRCEFAISGNPYIGQARCEVAPQPKLVLILEGD